MNKQISLPNVVFVYRYSEFFIGALTQLKKNGMGPGEGGASGLSASSCRGHESVNLNLYWGNLTKSFGLDVPWAMVVTLQQITGLKRFR